jgi:hypothetical protein
MWQEQEQEGLVFGGIQPLGNLFLNCPLTYLLPKCALASPSTDCIFSVVVAQTLAFLPFLLRKPSTTHAFGSG